MEMNKMILCTIFTLALTLTYSSTTSAKSSGDYWLQLSQSQRVNYLVGYIQGVDTGVDVAPQYKGTIFESFLYSSEKLKSSMLERATELYQNRLNKVVDWKSMLLLACSELEGESKDIVEERLRMMRELLGEHFGKKDKKPGDYWLLLPKSDRGAYLEGLIEGIRACVFLKEQQDERRLTLFEGLFNVGSEIEAVAGIVTNIYKNPVNRIIDYRLLFPISFLKFNKTEEATIEQLLGDLRKTERKRRMSANSKAEIELFKKKIAEQEDQLFGISLYFQGIIFLYSDNDEIVQMNKMAHENIMERGNMAIREAKWILKEVQEDPNKIDLIREFQFPPIHGALILDETTKRVRILVGTYHELFPGRPREIPLSKKENLKLMEAAASKLNY